MDYGQHLVTTLVCFVKAEGGVGFCPRGAFVRGGALVRGGGLCPTPVNETRHHGDRGRDRERDQRV